MESDSTSTVSNDFWVKIKAGENPSASSLPVRNLNLSKTGGNVKC